MISASEMCIYTNDNFTIESLAMEEDKEESKDGEEEDKKQLGIDDMVDATRQTTPEVAD